MEFARNRTSRIWEETNAGGMDNVPPAHCPPAACVSACGAAHVERTGGAGTNTIAVVGPAGLVHGAGRAWPLAAVP
ncbi:MAG: hypothetical protein HY869_08910 [Chloroflexi bacterium]|nr:hypothetical protein [Chloroflexota bacterium]